MNQQVEELIEIINDVTKLIEMLWNCSENVQKGTTKQHLLWAELSAKNSLTKMLTLVGQETGLNPESFEKKAVSDEFYPINECKSFCEKIITDFSLLDVTKSKLKTLYTSAVDDLQEVKKFIEKANKTHK